MERSDVRERRVPQAGRTVSRMRRRGWPRRGAERRGRIAVSRLTAPSEVKVCWEAATAGIWCSNERRCLSSLMVPRRELPARLPQLMAASPLRCRQGWQQRPFQPAQPSTARDVPSARAAPPHGSSLVIPPGRFPDRRQERWQCVRGRLVGLARVDERLRLRDLQIVPARLRRSECAERH
jgi:hypothetical protein